MAQVVLISINTYHENVNEIGDIVGVFYDSQTFSIHEESIFDILRIPGVTKEEISIELKKLSPEQKRIYRSATTEWTTTEPERDRAWKNKAGEWCFLNPHKYPFTVRGMSVEVYKDLENPTIDTETKKTLIAQNFKETISLTPGNDIKIPNLVGV